MNLLQLLSLCVVAVLVAVGVTIEALKVLAVGRGGLEPFEIVGINAISFGFLGLAGAMLFVVVF
ncbi:MAG: hypothetical protein KDE20_28470, partial [Caldilineaceae bacterium]|nr:hypothetical protein [Caldilineaceae bacterium]